MTYSDNYNYTLGNVATDHIFLETDDLKKALRWFHNINKRKVLDCIWLLDNTTGEILKMK